MSGNNLNTSFGNQPDNQYNDYAEFDNLNTTKKSIAQEIGRNRLKEENKKLKKELHRLRKIEAGFFGRDAK